MKIHIGIPRRGMLLPFFFGLLAGKTFFIGIHSVAMSKTRKMLALR